MLLAHSLTPVLLLVLSSWILDTADNQHNWPSSAISFIHLLGAEAHVATSRLTPTDSVLASFRPCDVTQQPHHTPHAGDPANIVLLSPCEGCPGDGRGGVQRAEFAW